MTICSRHGGLDKIQTSARGRESGQRRRILHSTVVKSPAAPNRERDAQLETTPPAFYPTTPIWLDISLKVASALISRIIGKTQSWCPSLLAHHAAVWPRWFL